MNTPVSFPEIIKEIQAQNAQLIAVSKTKPESQIMDLYEQGQLDFGENRVQELVDKEKNLPKDIHWHMIGHLQTNKVKFIASFVHLIHSVDSFKLLKEINKQAQKENRTINCLLQFKIAQEESKFGFDLHSAEEMLNSETFQVLQSVNILGVMGMGTFTHNMVQVRTEFQKLKNIFDHLHANFFKQKTDFQEISMGMSGDYKIALEEGSTMVRIGSLIFGSRY